jgi:hypothetical protein
VVVATAVAAVTGVLATPAMASPAAPQAPAGSKAAAGSKAPAGSKAAAAISWANKRQLTLRDRCGGANGWVQWTGAAVQTYGLVWTNAASCGGPGVHYIKLTWTDPGRDSWSSLSNGGAAGPSQTVGFNSGVRTGPFNVGNIVAYLCSTEGTGNCNVAQPF